MTTPAQRSRLGDLALPTVLIAIAIVVWTVPMRTFSIWTRRQINPDVVLYHNYASSIVHGALAYRDVRIEYPPGATGIFTATWWIPGHYTDAFSALMLACLCIAIVGVVASARALGYSPLRQAIAGGLLAVCPMAIGSLVAARFDLAVAAIVAWMMFAAITERWKSMWVLLAAGILVKIVPLALLPLLMMWHARRVGWRAAWRGVAGCLALVAVVILPFALLAPRGTWYFMAYNLRRPPQVESMASSMYLAVHAITGTHMTVYFAFGGENAAGRGPALLASALTVVLAVLILVLAVRCWRLLEAAHPTRAVEVLVAGSAATIVSLTVAGKVLSPQYMMWFLPVIPLLPGRFWKAATATMVAAWLLTQAFFPIHYWDVIALREPWASLFLLRNVALVVLLVLCWPRRGLGTLPIAGRVIGGSRDHRSSSGPATSVPARHIMD
jgi:hypothetical protein